MYGVYDGWGILVKRFPTYKQAVNYKYIFGNKTWTIR